MRYYDLTLTDPAGKATPITSHPGGKFDSGALNIIFDVTTTVGDMPLNQSIVMIEGVPLQMLSNARNFAATIQSDGSLKGGYNLLLKCGMKNGLPLANSSQAGPIVGGSVLQSWGNWTGTEMNISFVVVPTIYSYDTPGNITFIWKPGQSLQDALTQTFKVAYPSQKIRFAIKNIIGGPNVDYSYHATFTSLAQHVLEITTSQGYDGVRITMAPAGISVFDGTVTPQPTKLQFQDLIGQPTWIEYNTIQVICVMRGDIQVGDAIQMPEGIMAQPGMTVMQPQSHPAYANYNAVIKGKFLVVQMRHLGNYRDPNGISWATIMNCVAML